MADETVNSCGIEGRAMQGRGSSGFTIETERRKRVEVPNGYRKCMMKTIWRKAAIRFSASPLYGISGIVSRCSKRSDRGVSQHAAAGKPHYY